MIVTGPGSGGNTGTANDIDGADGPLGFAAPGGRKSPRKRPARKAPRPAPRKATKKTKPARKARRKSRR